MKKIELSDGNLYRDETAPEKMIFEKTKDQTIMSYALTEDGGETWISAISPKGINPKFL